MLRTMTAKDASILTGVDITRELDRVKSKVFIGTNAAFLASVMSSLEFEWSDDIDTAATNGMTFWWNPVFFVNLGPDERKTVLVHELWHAALLHIPRIGNRDHKVWNIACDIRINNGLENDGYSFKTIEDCCKDQTYGLLSEEDIYDDLMKNAIKIPVSPMWGNGPCVPTGSGGQQGNQGAQGQPEFDRDCDMIPSDRASNMAAVNNVVRAIHHANAAGQPGSVPGGLQEIIDQFLKPIVPWEQLFQRWMGDLLDEDYTWARPNRRYQDIYLPSRFQDEGRLEHMLFCQDTSGSMLPPELKRTNSEIKYIKDKMNPKLLTTLQFDTVIHRVDVFKEEDAYELIQVEGRGGTDLREVRQYIIDHRPTAVVIFTDLHVTPMEFLPFNVPILWVTKTKGVKPPFGDLVIMNEKAW
jgi:predicted metal-dependent peptidase